MVRSTLLCPLSWGALRAKNPLQRKCGLSIHPRIYELPSRFQMKISTWYLDSSMSYNADSWTYSQKRLELDVQNSRTWSPMAEISPSMPNLKNLLKMISHACLIMVLIENGAQHSPLSFVLGGPSGRKVHSTQMWYKHSCKFLLATKCISHVHFALFFKWRPKKDPHGPVELTNKG